MGIIGVMTTARPRSRAPSAVLLVGGSVIILLLSTLFWAPTIETADVVLFGVALTYFLVLGTLILSRVPGNRIGWLFSLIALSIASSGLLEALGELGFRTASTIAGGLWLLWIGLAPLLLFWFPTGRAPTGRWLWVERLLIAMIAVNTLTAIFTENLCQEGDAGECLVWVDNPIGIPGVPHPEYSAGLGVALLGGLVISVAAMVWRYRISGRAERLQLKWFLLATSLFIASIVAETAYEGLGLVTPIWVGVLNAVGILSIPVAATIAILRYRLYEIDRIISRTVTYALVAGLLAAVVAAVAALAGSQFQEPLVVATTTLGVAAVFNPLRRRVQRLVDHRFNRTRFDAERVISRFTDSLRDEIDPDAVISGWRTVVADTMQPSTVGVWTRL
jgi:hypothetical protein